MAVLNALGGVLNGAAQSFAEAKIILEADFLRSLSLKTVWSLDCAQNAAVLKLSRTLGKNQLLVFLLLVFHYSFINTVGALNAIAFGKANTAALWGLLNPPTYAVLVSISI